VEDVILAETATPDVVHRRQGLPDLVPTVHLDPVPLAIMEPDGLDALEFL